MKKIISLLSVVAMIASLITTVAFADENNRIYWEETRTDTEVTLKLIIDTEYDIASGKGAFDISALVAKGIVPTFEKLDAYTFTVNSTSKVVAFTLGSADGYTSPIELGTITFQAADLTEDIELPSKGAAAWVMTTTKATGSEKVISNFTNEATGYKVDKIASEPIEPDKFEAKVNDGVITFENAALSEKNKEISGKAIKLFGKTYTVNAKSKFVISAKGITKTFGKTAAEYLGLEGDGEATGNVTVGIIYDKKQYEASDFSIATE